MPTCDLVATLRQISPMNLRMNSVKVRTRTLGRIPNLAMQMTRKPLFEEEPVHVNYTQSQGSQEEFVGIDVPT